MYAALQLLQQVVGDKKQEDNSLDEEIEEKRQAFQTELNEERQKLVAENEKAKESLFLDLRKKEQELKDLQEQLEKEKTFTLDQQLRSLKKIKLDVGGKLFTTSLSTLTSHPNSMLAAMFSGRFSMDKDEDGCFFIDRDGTYFHLILDWLRERRTPIVQNDYEKQRLLEEIKYYQLDGLEVLTKREYAQTNSDVFESPQTIGSKLSERSLLNRFNKATKTEANFDWINDSLKHVLPLLASYGIYHR